jgi:hypothetical protein
MGNAVSNALFRLRASSTPMLGDVAVEDATPLGAEQVEVVELPRSETAVSAIPSRPVDHHTAAPSRQTRPQRSIDALLTKISKDEYLLQTVARERSAADAIAASTPTVKNKMPALPDSIVKRIIEWVFLELIWLRLSEF